MATLHLTTPFATADPQNVRLTFRSAPVALGLVCLLGVSPAVAAPSASASFAELRDWVAANPGDPEMADALLRAVTVAPDATAAITLVEGAAAVLPDQQRRVLEQLVAGMHLMSGDVALALTWYLKAAGDGHTGATLEAAALLVETGESQQAMELLGPILADELTAALRARAFAVLGAARQDAGDTSGAQAALEDALASDPATGGGHQAALQLIQQLLSAGGEDAARSVLDSMGAVLSPERLLAQDALDGVNGPVVRAPSPAALLIQPPVVQERYPTNPRPDGADDVQVGAFRDQVNARFLIDALRGKGFTGSSAQLGADGVIRVVIPGVTDQQAAGLLQRLRVAGFDGFVIKRSSAPTN